MARKRMAKSLKYDHSEAILCYIMTYFMTSQKSIIRREVCRIAISHPWPSNEDLAYTMTSATFRSIEKIVSLKLNVQNRHRR